MTCEHFYEKEVATESKTNYGGRNPRRPSMVVQKLCRHHSSKHRGNTIGMAICDGDIEICDIPVDER